MISNSTTVIHLVKLGRLSLLRELYQRILIPKAVHAEIFEKPVFPPSEILFLENALREGWIEVRSIKEKYQGLLESLKKSLGEGEAEALVLCIQEKEKTILCSDRKVMYFADDSGIEWKSTLGILLEALILNKVTLEEYISLVLKYEEIAWVSKAVIHEYLEMGKKLKGES
jgi:predicted nucleic acid-binding protein